MGKNCKNKLQIMLYSVHKRPQQSIKHGYLSTLLDGNRILRTEKSRKISPIKLPIFTHPGVNKCLEAIKLHVSLPTDTLRVV